MNKSERKTMEHSHTTQHPLWRSVVLSLFPGVALGAFIVGISPVLKGWGLDPIFALFGGIGLVIVPLELGCLAIVARRTTGSWSPLAVTAYRSRLPLSRLLPNFRGYLLPRIDRYGRWAPVLNTLLFSIYHMWTPWRWPQIAVGFLPLALAAWRTRSIYVSMTAHVTVNIVFLVLLTASFAAG